MTKKKTALLAACTTICAFTGSALRADLEHCTTNTAGVQTTGSPSFHNIGQNVIGISTNPTTIARHGSLHCVRMHTTCLLGDVNGDFLIDGADVQRYTEVKLTGTGTPRELCAAAPDVPEFVNLLMNQP